MNKIKNAIITLLFLLTITFSFGQNASSNEEGFSDWLFIQSDKALQYRFKEVSQESGIGYYQIQFKINFEDPIFCKHPTCLGYLLVLGYPSLDNEKNLESSYAFYNTFKGVYTLPELVPIKLDFPDGSKRMLRQKGFFYSTAAGGNELPAQVFRNCVDNILSTDPNYHRCKPYRPEFKEAEAKILK